MARSVIRDSRCAAQAGRALLVMAGASQRADLDLHQPLGGKGDHLA
jgi:hypothetical protein